MHRMTQIVGASRRTALISRPPRYTPSYHAYFGWMPTLTRRRKTAGPSE
jgi:hypothetical protein